MKVPRGKFKGITNEKIIKASIDLVRKDGASSLTMHKLAAKLKIKAPSLYKHVSGLDEIQDAIHAHALEILNHRLADALAEAEASSHAKLRAFLLEYKSFAEDEPGLYSLMQITHIGRSAEVGKQSEVILYTFLSILQQFEISQEKIIHTARFIRSWLHGFIDLQRRNAFGLDQRAADSFDEGIERILDMLVNDNLEE